VSTNGLVGGIEAGGTKFVCAIGDGSPRLLVRETFPTQSPEETMADAIAFFRRHASAGDLSHIGVAAFGPIDLHRHSPTYGRITSTPKLHWQDYDIVRAVARGTGVARVSVDTDVNCAALAEWLWGAGRHCDPFLYVTLGTGIGVGAIVNGRPIHGLVHPEAGHMRIPHDRAVDPFPGCCPSHGDCWEGVASGAAVAARGNGPAGSLPAHHPVWALVTSYTADALANLILTFSPERIVVGGGLRPRVLGPTLHRQLHERLNGYVRAKRLEDGLADFVVPPELGDDAGVLGAIALTSQPSRV
jgi:fructokinase